MATQSVKAGKGRMGGAMPPCSVERERERERERWEEWHKKSTPLSFFLGIVSTDCSLTEGGGGGRGGSKDARWNFVILWLVGNIYAAAIYTNTG